MGGKSDGDQRSEQTVTPWPGAQPHMLDVMGRAQDLTQQGAPHYYPGQTFAPRDPLQDQAQQLRLNYGMNSMPGQIHSMQAANDFALRSPDAANNPYVQGMMDVNQDRVNRNFTENLLPAINRGAMMHGQVGGTRQGVAEGIAARGTQEALAQQNAATMLDAYGKGLGAQSIAIGQAPQTMMAGMAPMDIMAGVGEYNRGIDSEALAHDKLRWDTNQMTPWDNAQRYAGIIAGNNAWGSNTNATGGGGSSPFAGAIGGGLLGASAASMPMFNVAGATGGVGALGSAMGGWALPLLGAGAGLLFS